MPMSCTEIMKLLIYYDDLMHIYRSEQRSIIYCYDAATVISTECMLSNKPVVDKDHVLS
jgi:hypothetical protein